MGKNKKKNQKKKSHMPLRLNIVFFIVFILFAVLILQLGVVQILNGEEAQKKIDRTENTTTNIPVPRGEMYDRYGRVLVDNQPLYSITYTPPKGVQAADRLALAKQLSQYIQMDTDNLTSRNLKEYYFLQNRKEIQERTADTVTDDMDNGDVYQLQLDSIKKNEINSFGKKTKEVIAIKKELDQASALSPHVIKNADISEEEYSKVAEHLANLPGINVTSDWERSYPYGQTFKNYVGSITTRQEGVPRDDLEYYMSLDYSRNDRVGESGLEQEYEDVLRGMKEKVQYTTDKENNVVDTKVIRQGSRGKDLVLTIDMELQEKLDKIVKDEVVKAVNLGNGYVDNAIAVMSNPQTGEILGISGQTYNHNRKKGEPLVSDSSSQAIYNAYAPGSIVKGATVLTAFHEGVIDTSTTIYDKTLHFYGGLTKSSYVSLQYVNYLKALRKSSNVFMFYVAMWLGGEHYEPNKKLDFKSDTYETFLYDFNQFGLGVKTGIDLPYESTGVIGTDPNPGNILDFAIGQYNTYTAMQMNQYVSTIANGGSRIRPHLVKEIHNPAQVGDDLGPVEKTYSPDVLNTLEMSKTNINRVQEGFREVFQHPEGTAYSTFHNKDYNPAGKSGTAQVTKYIKTKSGYHAVDRELENLTLVGYAPANNPEVAVTVFVPYMNASSSTHINYEIGEKALDAYFDLKKQRQKNGVNMNLNKNEKE